jgi:hypothetical protein
VSGCNKIAYSKLCTAQVFYLDYDRGSSAQKNWPKLARALLTKTPHQKHLIYDLIFSPLPTSSPTVVQCELVAFFVVRSE